MAKRRKTPAQKTWTNSALTNLANAWLAKGNAPTPEMMALAGRPGNTYTPPQQTVVDPGIPEAPPTQPFLTPDQMAAVNELFFDVGNQLSGLTAADTQALSAVLPQIGDPNKFNPNDAGTDLTQQTNKEAMQSKVTATDAAIARGLFQSSIRDADLVDIEATRQMRRNFFRDQYQSVIKTNADQRKRITDFLKTQVGDFDPEKNPKIGGVYGGMAVQNAKDTPGAPGKPPTIQSTPARINVAGVPQATPQKRQAVRRMIDTDPTRHGASMEYVFSVGRGAPKRRRGRRRG